LGNADIGFLDGAGLGFAGGSGSTVSDRVGVLALTALGGGGKGAGGVPATLAIAPLRPAMIPIPSMAAPNTTSSAIPSTIPAMIHGAFDAGGRAVATCGGPLG
jgi:hypothetical protein